MTNEGDSEFVFQAVTYSLSHISNILGALQNVSSKVLISIDNDGVNFITENSHVCRVELTLEKSLFTSYSFNPAIAQDDVRFTVDLKPIVESLSLANKNDISNAQCTLVYESDGSPFILIFEDSKMIERCEFSTFINLDLEANNLGFELNQEEIVMEGMIKADVLYDVLKDLKDLDTDEIYIYASTRNPKSNKFAIISKNELGNSILYLPNEKSILENLSVNNEHGVDISCFKFSMFNMILRAIKLTNKCKFKRDGNILSLNLLSLYGNDLPKNYTGTIIDFKILQLIDKEEQIQEFIENLEGKLVDTQPPVLANGGALYSQETSTEIEVPIFL